MEHALFDDGDNQLAYEDELYRDKDADSDSESAIGSEDEDIILGHIHYGSLAAGRPSLEESEAEGGIEGIDNGIERPRTA